MFELLKKETLRIVEKLELSEADFECQFIKGFESYRRIGTFL